MPGMGTRLDRRQMDRGIAAIAAMQHGTVAYRQLHALGLSNSAVARRVATGRLHRLHKGVYAVGHPAVTLTGHWRAATLACGPDAFLSHRSAAALWDLRPAVQGHPPEVLVRRGGGRKRPGITVHRTIALDPEDVTVHCGIPVTTAARTLVDLAEVVSPRALERALDEAEEALRLDWRTVDAVLDRHPARIGTRRVRAAMARHEVGSTRSRSPLEEAVLALCDRHDLPRPRLNAMVAGMEVDCWWPEHRLVVEADSRRHHLTTRAFERDRIRDAELLLAGMRVLRLTHHRLSTDEEGVATTLRRLLAPPG